MARGPSGRLVIEVDPSLKNNLHAALAADGATLKEWFIDRASEYLQDRLQPKLPTFGNDKKGDAVWVTESPVINEKRPALLQQDHHSTKAKSKN